MPSNFSKTEGGSAEPGARPLPDTVVVGRVIGVRGLKGDLVVEVLSDVPGRLDAGARLAAVLPTGERRAVQVVSATEHPRGAVLRLRGVEDRDAALALRGATFEIPRPAAAERGAGTYFEYELVGCECVDRSAGELGVLEDVIENGAGQLLRIVGPRGVLLVPFVESFLERVDVAGRRIALRLPDGLVETCVSRS
jgi:16S rRNA processing protein RimM